MRLLQPSPAAGVLGLRAMKTIAAASGSIGPAQRALMETARQVLLKVDADIDALAPIAPAELAAGFPDPALRRQFVNGMLVVALADGIPSPATASAVAAFAEALGVETPELTDLRRLAEHQMLLFRLDFLRRGHIADIMRNQLDQHGLIGLAKSVLGMRGLIEDRELLARGDNTAPGRRVPADRSPRRPCHGRLFPGQWLLPPGGEGRFPEAGVYHDFSHLLGGYGTDAAGEVEVAAFTAGYKRERPFYLVLFAVLIFSTDVNVRPAPGGVSIGVLGEPGVAARMFAAIERGSAVTLDLSDKWDYSAPSRQSGGSRRPELHGRVQRLGRPIGLIGGEGDVQGKISRYRQAPGERRTCLDDLGGGKGRQRKGERPLLQINQHQRGLGGDRG